MARQVLKGRITDYRPKKEVASFTFADSEPDAMGAVALSCRKEEAAVSPLPTLFKTGVALRMAIRDP